MGKNMDLDGDYHCKHIVNDIQKRLENGEFNKDFSSLAAINGLLHIVGYLESECLKNFKMGFELSASQCVHKKDGLAFDPHGHVYCDKEVKLKKYIEGIDYVISGLEDRKHLSSTEGFSALNSMDGVIKMLKEIKG